MSPVPSDDQLEADLSEVLGEVATIECRRASGYSSTFTTEIVSIRKANGTDHLFCKHGVGYTSPVSGHRRGVPYEAAVYESLVAVTEAPSVAYLGCVRRTESSTLVLELLDDALRIHKAPFVRVPPLISASFELGRWHRRARTHLHDVVVELNRFDVVHLTRLAPTSDVVVHEPTLEVLRPLGDLIASSAMAEALSETATTIIHGELFTSNVLVTTRGSVRFIDWESAGSGPGELDLAALTAGGWRASTRDACVEAYVAGRFAGREPAGFRRSLAAAEIHVLCEVLRHQRRRDPVADPPSWLLPQLDAAIRRLGAGS